jgi:hypothetical protein
MVRVMFKQTPFQRILERTCKRAPRGIPGARILSRGSAQRGAAAAGALPIVPAAEQQRAGARSARAEHRRGGARSSARGSTAEQRRGAGAAQGSRKKRSRGGALYQGSADPIARASDSPRSTARES